MKTAVLWKYFPWLLTLAFAIAGCAAHQVRDSVSQELTILHTNDSHAGYGGLTKDGRPCYAAVCEGGRGGTMRLQQAVRAIRRDAPDSLLLDAGDQFQGTLFSTVHKEAVTAELMNALDYQAFVPGNHEFDDGCGRFFSLVASLHTPVVAANLSLPSAFQEKTRIKPWIILERKGRRIGIIGLANTQTPSLSSPCPEVGFEDEANALRKAVQEFQRQNVNIVIALTHLGLETDRELARSVSGVDVIVGGHSHSLLSNTHPGALAPYPVVERSPLGDPVLVVTASFGLEYLGRLRVGFDEQGRAVSWNGNAILLDDSSLAALNAPAADPTLARTLEQYAQTVQSMMRAPLGRIEREDQTGFALEEPNVLQCREKECLSGNIVTDAMLHFAGLRVQAALLNGGTLRNSLPTGKVTAGDVLAALPFQNTVCVADISGKTLLESLEYGVSLYGDGGGRFLQTAGIKYVFDLSKPAGKRVQSTSMLGADGAWRPICPQTTYRIAAPDYLARGGDGYAMLAGLEWKNSEQILNDVVREYIEKHSPLAPQLEGRSVAR